MRRGRIVLTAVALVVVWILFFVFFIRPRQSELAEVRAEIETARQETLELQTELARLEELQANAPELEAQLAQIRQFVPRDNQVPNFIFLVQDAANRAGVGFVRITPELPKQPPEGAALAEVRMTIGARGGYFALQDFLRRIEDLDRAARMDSVTLVSEVQAAEGTFTINLDMFVRIFFELPQAAVPVATPGAVPVGPGAPTPTPTIGG